MSQKSTLKLLSISLGVTVLAACGGGNHRADYTEQTCQAEGSVYWIQLVSFDAESRKDAVLADGSKADVVERANAIVEPSAISLVFSGQGLSFHGFDTSAFAVGYKDVTYLRFADEAGDQGALVIDYLDESQATDSAKETRQESVTGLSPTCTDGLQEYLSKQGVTLSS